MTPVGSPQSLSCQPLNIASLPADDLEALDTFNTKVAALSRAISAADAHLSALQGKLPYLEQAVLSVGAPNESWLDEISDITIDLREVDEQLNGGAYSTILPADWKLILPFLQENERLFGIRVHRDLLTVDGVLRKPSEVYRKVAPSTDPEIEAEMEAHGD